MLSRRHRTDSRVFTRVCLYSRPIPHLLCGVGRPVVDQLRTAGLSPIPVTITAGSAVTFQDGFWHVPKHELVRALVAPLEGDRLRIATRLSYATALKDELQAFTRKVTGAGRSAYGATSGAHGDLVIAVALAVWWLDMRDSAIWRSSTAGWSNWALIQPECDLQHET